MKVKEILQAILDDKQLERETTTFESEVISGRVECRSRRAWKKVSKEDVFKALALNKDGAMLPTIRIKPTLDALTYIESNLYMELENIITTSEDKQWMAGEVVKMLERATEVFGFGE